MEEILDTLNSIELRLLAIWWIALCVLTLHIVAELREAFLMVTALKMQRDNKEAVEISKQQREEDRDLFAKLFMKNVHVVTFKPEDVEEDEDNEEEEAEDHPN